MIRARTAALSARFSGVSGSVSRSCRTLSQCRSASAGLLSAHPLGRPAMPLRRFPSVARMLPVVGEKRRTLAELPRLELLDRTRDRAVDAGSSLRELRAVGDFLGQRVLEGVLGLRIERLLVEELGARERMESGGQISVAEVRHAPENRLGELLADHRRRLEQPLLPLG